MNEAAIAGDWLKAHNAGQADWAAAFYAPDALIRDSDGVTFHGAGSAWERLTSGLYRYEVVDAAWTGADTLRWEISASPVQFLAPPRHFALTVHAGQITAFEWSATDRLTIGLHAHANGPGSGSWPLTPAALILTGGPLVWMAVSRRRTPAATTRRLNVIEPLRALADTRRET